MTLHPGLAVVGFLSGILVWFAMLLGEALIDRFFHWRVEWRERRGLGQRRSLEQPNAGGASRGFEPPLSHRPNR